MRHDNVRRTILIISHQVIPIPTSVLTHLLFFLRKRRRRRRGVRRRKRRRRRRRKRRRKGEKRRGRRLKKRAKEEKYTAQHWHFLTFTGSEDDSDILLEFRLILFCPFFGWSSSTLMTWYPSLWLSICSIAD